MSNTRPPYAPPPSSDEVDDGEVITFDDAPEERELDFSDDFDRDRWGDAHEFADDEDDFEDDDELLI